MEQDRIVIDKDWKSAIDVGWEEITDSDQPDEKTIVIAERLWHGKFEQRGKLPKRLLKQIKSGATKEEIIKIFRFHFGM